MKICLDQQILLKDTFLVHIFIIKKLIKLAEASRNILSMSQLSNEILGQVWNLSFMSNGMGLSYPEFCLAMFLVKAKLEGKDVPQVLPDKVKQCVLQSISRVSSLWNGQNSPFVASIGIQPGSMSTNPSMVSITSQISHISQSSPLSSTAKPISGIPPMTQTASFVSQNTNDGISTPTMTPSASLTEAPRVWLIGPDEKAQYDSIFRAWDPTNTGFITRNSFF